MLIIGGQNHYPQDIEDAVRAIPGVHKGRAVAVVVPADPADDWPERVAVLAEIGSEGASDAVAAAIRAAVAQELGGAAADVLLLRKGALLRTTSGKYQRLLMRDRLLAGNLDGVFCRDPDRSG
jgi:acyl-CoA synthetase (AMP-forming)/AMP-acid ligase II